MKIEDFKEEHLKKAIKIYNQILYQKETSETILENFVNSIKEQIKEFGWSYGISGFPHWKHARMQIGSPNNEKYYYSIDTNDDNPEMNKIIIENLEYKIKIESEWKDAGIPTKI